MRVTTGIAKGRKLESPKGYETRPTSDKVKQSLFSIINNEIVDANFLDLFSGTGQIGIEALSRGATECGFVENNKNAMGSIIKNLKHTNFLDKACTYAADVENALHIIAAKGKTYNFIFMDPPYSNGEYMKGLSDLIKNLKLLKNDGYIIGEHSAIVNMSAYEDINIIKKKAYGSTTVVSFWTPF